MTSNQFDSIAVSLSYFPTITLTKNRLEAQKIYEVLITPSDKIYELDKENLKFRKRSISNRNKKIKFSKIS